MFIILLLILFIKDFYFKPLCDKVIKKGKRIILVQNLTIDKNPIDKSSTLIIEPNNKGFILIDIKKEKDFINKIEYSLLKLYDFGKELLNSTPEFTFKPTFTEYFIGPYNFRKIDFYCLNIKSKLKIIPCNKKEILDRFFFIPFISKTFSMGNYFAICIGNLCLKRERNKKQTGYIISYKQIKYYEELNDERFLFQFYEKGNLINKLKNISKPIIGEFQGCKEEDNDSLFNLINNDNKNISKSYFQLENILNKFNKLYNKFQLINSNNPKLINKSNDLLEKLKLLNLNDSKILEKIDYLISFLKNNNFNKIDDVVCDISLLKSNEDKLSDNINNVSNLIPNQVLNISNILNNINNNINSLINNTNTINNDMRIYNNTLEGISLKQDECNKSCCKEINKLINNNNKNIYKPNCYNKNTPITPVVVNTMNPNIVCVKNCNTKPIVPINNNKNVCIRKETTNIPQMYLNTTNNSPSLSDWRYISKIN